MSERRWTIWRHAGAWPGRIWHVGAGPDDRPIESVEVAPAADLQDVEEQLEKLREVVELECDGLATLWSQFDPERMSASALRVGVETSERRLLAAARAAALPGQEEQ